MPLIDEIRAQELERLARARFDAELTEPELKILRDSASSVDPPEPDEKTPKPEVRAEFLRWLATDAEAATHIDPRGIRVWGATVPRTLDLDECRVSARLYFRRCEFKSEISLESARTRGIFVLDSAVAEITADRAFIDGPLFLRRTQATGEVRLPRAEIAVDLDCSGAKLTAEGDALSADGARIGGSVFLREGFECSGEIRLLGAAIAGDLSCSGAKLTAKGYALSADGARIGGNVFLREGFECSGQIRLLGAEIEGDLTCVDSAIRSISCLNLAVGGDLLWYEVRNAGTAGLILSGASIKNLRDDKESWPSEGNLVLDGLEYEELTLHERPTSEEIEQHYHSAELPLSADERIEWILRQGPERREEPQPWMQLRSLLEKKGDRKGAKHVLYRFRCLEADKSRFLLRWWKKIFAWIEENEFRIAWPIAATLLIGTLIFNWAGNQKAMTPTDAGAAGSISAHYPKYQPFIYTLENSVPLVKFGMDNKWAPDPAPPFCQPWFPSVPWLYFISTYGVLVFTRWALIVGGWFQASVLAAALAGRFKN